MKIDRQGPSCPQCGEQVFSYYVGDGGVDKYALQCKCGWWAESAQVDNKMITPTDKRIWPDDWYKKYKFKRRAHPRQQICDEISRRVQLIDSSRVTGSVHDLDSAVRLELNSLLDWIKNMPNPHANTGIDSWRVK